MGAENNCIDWNKIFDAYRYYGLVGFRNRNVNWTVSPQYTAVTKPDNIQDLSFGGLCLVGSAEQSFIEMMDDESLGFGRYMALTPCFRDEDQLDILHREYFMKLELIDTANVTKTSLHEIIDLCKNFFERYCATEIIETEPDAYDIVDTNGTELGSYGIRRWKEHVWIYATGIAEPRLTTAMKIRSAIYS